MYLFQGLDSEEFVRVSPFWFRSNIENILTRRLYLWTIQNIRLLNYSQNDFILSHLKVIKFVGFSQWFPSQYSSHINSSLLKALTVVWLYDSYLTTQSTQHLNTHVYYNSIHTQFIRYNQSQSQWYNSKVTCYHTSWIIYTPHNINIYMV